MHMEFFFLADSESIVFVVYLIWCRVFDYFALWSIFDAL